MVLIRELLLALMPVFVLQVLLMVLALVDLVRREPGRVNGPKILWGIGIVVINIIGPIAYFVFGRKG